MCIAYQRIKGVVKNLQARHRFLAKGMECRVVWIGIESYAETCPMFPTPTRIWIFAEQMRKCPLINAVGTFGLFTWNQHKGKGVKHVKGTMFLSQVPLPWGQPLQHALAAVCWVPRNPDPNRPTTPVNIRGFPWFSKKNQGDKWR